MNTVNDMLKEATGDFRLICDLSETFQRRHPVTHESKWYLAISLRAGLQVPHGQSPEDVSLRTTW